MYANLFKHVTLVLAYKIQTLKENHKMTKKVLLVKYGEIALRKGNRKHFEYKMLNIIRNNIKDSGEIHVVREQGRFMIEDVNGDLDIKKILPQIKNIFGLTSFCLAIKTTERDIEVLRKIGLEFFKENMPKNAQSFKVETKRSDKQYPITSNEVSASIGEAIFDSSIDIKVNLQKPDITLWVEIRNYVYFYVDSITGEGGLPYGTSGKGMLLLSGGFDSPVAGYLAARRGVEIVPVYFHSPPFVSERAADKVRDLVKELSRYTGTIKMYIVPFTEIQLFLKEKIAPQKLTLMLKRVMLRITNQLADTESAQCLITGDSIGQVASQTLKSLQAMESATTLPIIRPLATMDKQDIINIAKRIGTFDISIRPYDDCCTLFVANHPETKPNTNVIEKIEARIFEELSPLIEKAIESITVL